MYSKLANLSFVLMLVALLSFFWGWMEFFPFTYLPSQSSRPSGFSIDLIILAFVFSLVSIIFALASVIQKNRNKLFAVISLPVSIFLIIFIINFLFKGPK